MKLTKTLILAFALAAGGCSTLDSQSLSGKTRIKNDQGHVVGYKEHGDGIDRVVLFTPRVGESGNVVAYEEHMKGGVILWDLRGKRVGSRYVDLRSRGTNAGNAGLTIVFRPRESEYLAAREYIAQVTIEDIKQHLGFTN